jgi:predicted metal-dependent peptidase
MKSQKEQFESLSYEEEREIAVNIIKYHGVFYKFWDLVKPSYTNSKKYPTACVVFNKENECIDFFINKKFWKKLSQEQKNFIICHECLHVILEHGKRACSTTARLNPEMVNACLDIPINEMLAKYFNFERKEIDPKRKYCWADTVFPKQKLPNDQSYEFYFNKFKNDKDTSKISMSGMGSGESSGEEIETNNHEGLSSFNEKKAESKIEEFVNSLSEEEKESLKEIADRIERSSQKNNSTKDDENDSKTAGTSSGSLSKLIGKIKPKPKKKWETVIKKWSQKFSRAEKEDLHWLVKSRRHSLIDTDFFIASDTGQEIKKNNNEKIDVWMFLDTSGSCESLAPRFWKAANSLPKDKFNVFYHCFDTQVFKLNEKDVERGKLYGFGGTSFIALENFIQKTLKKEGKKYSNIGAVFVITDGMGDYIKPENPKKWYWFLSENYTHCIPKNSYTFILKDFE